MASVLVTGGTGFVGREVVRQLLAAGHRVRLLVRKKKDFPGVEQVEASFSDGAALEAACRGIDAVIHLVGIIAETKGETFEKVHTGATRAMVGAAERAGVPRYLQMSALGARPDARARYQRTKGEAEAIVRASKLSWTIFRPSIVFGPHDQFVNQFARTMYLAFPLIGGGKTLFQPVAVEDVAACFVLALAKPETIGKSYDLAGAERLSLREILQEIARLKRRHVLFFPMPWKVAEFMGTLFQTILPKPPLTHDQVVMLKDDNIGDSTPAAQAFGIAWKPFRAGIAAYLVER